MTETRSRLADRLSDFVAGIDWDRIPAPVREAAVNAFRDWLANAAGGISTPFGSAILKIVDLAQEAGPATIIGSRRATSPLTAALVNGGVSHTLEFDDAHRGTFYHPGSPAIAAALAAAQAIDSDGPRLLAGIVAGYEVGVRVAAALGPAHYKVWHMTGTAGVFAGAAAASCVLGLSAAQSTAAFGLAGTQASGLWEVLAGAPAAKNLHPGRAAQSGLLAAMLAREGLEGPSSILEGDRGVFAAMVPDGANADAVVEGLGDRWRILEITFKAYPICGHASTPVEAALATRPQLGPAVPKRILVHSNAISIRVAGDPAPQDGYAAKFSIPYCVAVALLRGKVTQAEFEPDVLRDPVVCGVMNLVEMIADPEYDRIVKTIRPARLQVDMDDGRKIEAVSETRRGDPEQPLTTEEMRTKFRGLAALAWGGSRAERVDAGIDELVKSHSINRWMSRVLSEDGPSA